MGANCIYKITEILLAFWLVKNLCLLYPTNSYVLVKRLVATYNYVIKAIDSISVGFSPSLETNSLCRNWCTREREKSLLSSASDNLRAMQHNWSQQSEDGDYQSTYKKCWWLWGTFSVWFAFVLCFCTLEQTSQILGNSLRLGWWRENLLLLLLLLLLLRDCN